MSKALKLTNYTSKFPTLSQWGKSFRYRNTKVPRSTLANSQVAVEALQKLKLDNIKNMTAVELNPGLGAWTSALKDAGFQRIIALEPQSNYLQWIQGMSEQSNGVIDVVKKDGYDWETYMHLKDPKYLGNLGDSDWSKVNPNILFTGTFPKGSRGEMLLAQFSSCVVNKMAMHSIGRIQMAFWIPDNLFQKYVAPPGNHNRCKMSVVAEASADVSLIHSTQPEDMYPNGVYHLVHIVPFEKHHFKAQYDVFEYVLKHLFVMQKKSLVHMVKTLGPGADIILSRLSFDPNINIGDMTAQQIDEVAIKFDEWPLRPRVLFEDASVFL